MPKIFKPFMRLHRFIQLIGLYGVIFLIPFVQQQINEYSSEEDDYKRKQTHYVVEQLYYDVKNLSCSQLGQIGTTHDCKKGIFQDLRLSSALKYEKEAAERKSETLSIYWLSYIVFSLFGFIGTFFEYKKEYENNLNSN